jgi:hypothetical protein
MQRAAPLAGLPAMALLAALLAACQTTPDAAPDTVAQTQPAQPPAAGARIAGGPIAASPANGASTAPAPSAPALPAPSPPAAAPEQQPDPVAQARLALPEPTGPQGPPVPHIYMALQPGGTSGQVSAVFTIDAARDNTPSDDPAVRLTPSNGLCNPQEMPSYTFPARDAARPVVSETEQDQGLTARNLPAFMAVSVTDRMLARGLASDREQTRALNVCTRKLWERLMAAGNQPAPVQQ